MRRTLYTPDHEDFRRSVRAFVERVVVPNYADWERDGIVPREVFTQVAELGLFAAVPEAFGGVGVHDLRLSLVFTEEMSRVGAMPAALGPLLQAEVVLPYLLELANEEQKARWLPGVASGELILGIAMTEPGAGSDLSGIQTKAVLDGDHYRVDGAKTFITNGINGDLFVTVVRTGSDPHRGLSLVVVERDTPGFSRGRKLAKIGMHAQDTAELAFDGARVPVANRLGEEGTGFFALTRNLPQERVSIAYQGLSVARAALDWTTDHVRERTAFGAPLGSLQSVRFRLAELTTEVDIMQAYLDACVVALERGDLTAVDAAKAKWSATELQGRVVDGCVQLFGGYGYMVEYPIARAYLDSRVSRIYGGATEIMKEIVGRSLKLG
jgi:alkylation response protein AidB-like acyl-CoA dehydrogenase